MVKLSGANIILFLNLQSFCGVKMRRNGTFDYKIKNLASNTFMIFFFEQ